MSSREHQAMFVGFGPFDQVVVEGGFVAETLCLQME